MEQRGRTLAVLFGGVLLGALDIAIVGPAMPAIRETYALDAAGLAWIFNSYILLSLISAPVLGAWSDRVGRRFVYVACLMTFGIGSAVVALSPSYAALICGRMIQALGAGGLLPVATAVIAETVPEARRGRTLGLIGALFGLAFVLGPLLGAVFLRWDWRWLFVLNLPVLAVLIPYALKDLPRSGTGKLRGLDLTGALLLAVALGSLALVLGGVHPRWLAVPGGPVGTVLLLTVSVAGFALFVRNERYADDPMVAPALLKAPGMWAVSVLALATGFVEAAMVFLPTLAVAALSITAQRASAMLLPLVAALIAGSIVAGRLVDRKGPVPVIRAGMLFIVIGLLILGFRRPDALTFYGGGLAVGFGLASLLGAPLRLVAHQAAGEVYRGAGQGVLTVFLGTGRLAGAAVIGGIVPSGDVETDGFRAAMIVVACLCAGSLAATRGLHTEVGTHLRSRTR